MLEPQVKPRESSFANPGDRPSGLKFEQCEQGSTREEASWLFCTARLQRDALRRAHIILPRKGHLARHFLGRPWCSWKQALVVQLQLSNLSSKNRLQQPVFADSESAAAPALRRSPMCCRDCEGQSAKPAHADNKLLKKKRVLHNNIIHIYIYTYVYMFLLCT